MSEDTNLNLNLNQNQAPSQEDSQEQSQDQTQEQHKKSKEENFDGLVRKANALKKQNKELQEKLTQLEQANKQQPDKLEQLTQQVTELLQRLEQQEQRFKQNELERYLTSNEVNPKYMSFVKQLLEVEEVDLDNKQELHTVFSKLRDEYPEIFIKNKKNITTSTGNHGNLTDTVGSLLAGESPEYLSLSLEERKKIRKKLLGS